MEIALMPAQHRVPYSFTQITINADQHPLMKRFHKPDAEKRSLVIVPQDEYDEWLYCRDPEIARTFCRLYPAELMRGWPDRPSKYSLPNTVQLQIPPRSPLQMPAVAFRLLNGPQLS